MKIYNLTDFKGGWFIGDFEPSILRTSEFEVNVRTHAKDEVWEPHFHSVATEYNVLISGKMDICGQVIESGTVFVIEPDEIAAPKFLEECTVVCIKQPSRPGDKYLV